MNGKKADEQPREKNAAAAALSALRWRGNVSEPTQPRRLKVSTICRLKAHQALIGASTMDAAIVDLLGRVENGADGKKEVYRAAPELLEALKYAAELVKVARRYFPKSIRDADAFQLENTSATIAKAIHQATGE